MTNKSQCSITITATFILITLFIGLVLSAPLQALECGNSGTAPTTAPDDTGDGGATACGHATVAGGDNSIALGNYASSSGNYSTALGGNASAVGLLSTALGYSADSIGDYSTALGYLTGSTGEGSTALGFAASSVADYSTAVGILAQADQDYAVVLGATAGVNSATVYSNVGIGVTAPLSALHVHRDDGTANILVEETAVEVASRTLFTLANPGNTKFEIMNTDAMNSWAFTNSGTDFRVSLQDSGVVEFRVDNNGDAYVAGLLFENSDRNAKTNIKPVDNESILEKVTQLSINHWAYKETPGSFHIGPMAQDFHEAFNTGTSDTQLATMDVGGVAIASIQALARQNQHIEATNTALKERNRQLEGELASLKQDIQEIRSMLLQSAPKLSQN